jgi:hypothetical protein
MWFLVRLAFWLGVVVLLLPPAPPQEIAPAPQVGATKTASATKGTVDATRRAARDTLTPADLALPWRGAQGRREAGRRVER